MSKFRELLCCNLLCGGIAGFRVCVVAFKVNYATYCFLTNFNCSERYKRKKKKKKLSNARPCVKQGPGDISVSARSMINERLRARCLLHGSDLACSSSNLISEQDLAVSRYYRRRRCCCCRCCFFVVFSTPSHYSRS